VMYAGAVIASSYDEAIGIAVGYHIEDIINGKLIAVGADTQDEDDLEELMKKRGWKEP